MPQWVAAFMAPVRAEPSESPQPTRLQVGGAVVGMAATESAAPPEARGNVYGHAALQ
jgi:hypothetical protein